MTEVTSGARRRERVGEYMPKHAWPGGGAMTSDDITEAAARWHALQDGGGLDWDRFTDWLEVDRRHREAFDAIALLDADVAVHRASIIKHLESDPPDTRGTAQWRFGSIAAGVAAAAAAMALFVGLPRPNNRPIVTTYRTHRGQTREIALREGSRITLASASRLSVSGPDQSQLAIAGSAYFDVPHRPDRELVIKANNATIHDIGTRFEIDADRSGTQVAVAEGEVTISSARASGSVPLSGGRVLWLDQSGTSAQLGSLRPADVASWRRGALAYDSAPLTLVADDISRYAGRPITVDPAVAARRFSGVLSIGDGSRLATDVAAIMALRVRPVGDGLQLEPAR